MRSERKKGNQRTDTNVSEEEKGHTARNMFAQSKLRKK